MSTAHRPTWSPAVGKEIKTGSRSTTQKDYSSRTKLKFRQPGQLGQTSASDVAKRDLRAELLKAEREAVNKKRKAQGLPPLAIAEGSDRLITASGEERAEEAGEDEQARKRRKVLEEAREVDRDDEDSEEEEGGVGKSGNGNGKGKGRAVEGDEDGEGGSGAGEENDDDDDSSSDDDSDEEDDTAALMAELAKIKQERAEEKARQQAESDSTNRTTRESEIALGNPLLNLQAALGQTPSRASDAGTSVTGSFAVKRRWDDDLVFKNQAVGGEGEGKKEFVNDLLRSEFHRKFMSKFIK